MLRRRILLGPRAISIRRTNRGIDSVRVCVDQQSPGDKRSLAATSNFSVIVPRQQWHPSRKSVGAWWRLRSC